VLHIAQNIALLCLPTQSPTFNPTEQLWKNRLIERDWKYLAYLNYLQDYHEAVFVIYIPKPTGIPPKKAWFSKTK